MDDPNITMEEYIRLEEEKARIRGKVFNWELLSMVRSGMMMTFTTSDPYSFDDSDDEDYTVIFDKNSFSYKLISTNDLKMDSDNDNEKVNMPLFSSPEPANLYVPFGISFDPKRYYKDGDCTRMLRGQVEGYTEEIVYDFEQRLETIFGRQVNRVHTLDFEGLTPDMRQNLAERLRMVYTRDDGQEVFVSHAWRRLFEIQAPLVQEFILEFFSTCRIGSEMGLDMADNLCFHLGGARRSMTWRQFILALGLHTVEEMVKDGFGAYWLGSGRVTPNKGDFSDYWVEISSGRDFLRGAPSYTYIRDSVRRLCHRHAKGRKSGVGLFRGHFIGRLAHHFGLVSDDGLRGLSIMTRELPMIDMGRLVKLNICMEIGDDWAWVAPGPERQPDVAAGATRADDDAPTVYEGAQADPAPVQAPLPPPPPPAAWRTMPQRLGRIEEEMQGLRQDVRSLRGLVERSLTDQGRFSTWMISCMTQLMKASGQTYQAFDGTFRGISPAVFERRTR
ncbi:hypothetical protein Tco_1280857 [Tanacetum coccineum]